MTLPPDFTPVTEADAPDVHVIKPELLADGILAAYHGTRTWTDGSGRKQTLHVITPPDAPTQHYGVYGTAQLNRLVRVLRKGERFFLRYDGKAVHPDDPSKELHTWTVGRANKPAADPDADTDGDALAAFARKPAALTSEDDA